MNCFRMKPTYHAVARFRQRYPNIFKGLNNKECIKKAKFYLKYSFLIKKNPDGTEIRTSQGAKFIVKNGVIITVL